MMVLLIVAIFGPHTNRCNMCDFLCEAFAWRALFDTALVQRLVQNGDQHVLEVSGALDIVGRV